MQCLVRSLRRARSTRRGAITITVRFLQVQQRRTQALDDHGGFVEVPELRVDGDRWFAWDEAIEIEHSRTLDVEQLIDGHSWDVLAEAGEDVEPVHDHRGRLAGRLVRERWEVRATATLGWSRSGPPPADRRARQ